MTDTTTNEGGETNSGGAGTGGNAPTGGNPNPAPQTGGEQRTPPTGDPAVKTEQQPDPNAPPAYKIPDAYKDKPWASKIKSEDDLYKQIDNLQSLAGKKGVPDFKTAKPEEVDGFFQQFKPADKAAYNFGETADPVMSGEIGDLLLGANIAEAQANKLIPAYQAWEQKKLEEATSAAGFKDVMTKNFGEKYDELVVTSQKVFAQKLSDDNKKMLDVMPNAYVAPMYQLVEKYEAEIKALKEQYGVKENGDAHTGGGNSPANATDLPKLRTELRQQINDLSKRPHTSEEKQALVNKLNDTFKGK